MPLYWVLIMIFWRKDTNYFWIISHLLQKTTRHKPCENFIFGLLDFYYYLCPRLKNSYDNT